MHMQKLIYIYIHIYIYIDIDTDTYIYIYASAKSNRLVLRQLQGLEVWGCLGRVAGVFGGSSWGSSGA